MTNGNHNRLASSDEAPGAPQPGGLLRRHPKLGILLIAAVFYIILIGMAALTLVLIFRR